MIFNLLAPLLLLLGFLNPVINSRLDIFIAFFLLSFVAYFLLGKSKVFLLSVLFVFLYFIKLKGFEVNSLIGIFAGISLGYFVGKINKDFAVGIIILLFLISAWANSTDLRAFLSRDLPLYTYRNDPGVFLKTYQLVKGNENYYSAFFMAQNGTFNGPRNPSDVWWFRMPTIFYLWSFLPGSGVSIYLMFLLLASASLIASYKIVLKFCSYPVALLAPYLLFGYLHYAARDQMLLETEWWGVMFFVIGLYFFFYKRFFWAIVLFALAVLTRELYVIPLFFMLITSLVYERKRMLVFLIPLLSFLLLFTFHVLSVTRYFGSFFEMFKPRLAGDGLFLIKQTLVFASWEYLFFTIRPFFFFLIFALIGVVYIFKKVDKGQALYVLASFILLPVAFLKIGSVPFNDYWGVMYMPIVLILAPIALGIFSKKLSTKV